MPKNPVCKKKTYKTFNITGKILSEGKILKTIMQITMICLDNKELEKGGFIHEKESIGGTCMRGDGRDPCCRLATVPKGFQGKQKAKVYLPEKRRWRLQAMMLRR